MKLNFVIALVIGCTFVAPIRALMCVTCDDCSNPSSIHLNKTCLSTEDSCMKLDFGHHIFKKCGKMSTMCHKEDFKINSLNTWEKIKTAVGTADAEAKLMSNMNHEGRTVLNCCNGMDYCNSAMDVNFSIMTIVGMSIIFFGA